MGKYYKPVEVNRSRIRSAGRMTGHCAYCGKQFQFASRRSSNPPRTCGLDKCFTGLMERVALESHAKRMQKAG